MGLEHDDHPPGEHTAPLTAQIRELVYPRFRVEVIEGPDTGASAISEGEELSIGSAEGNSLVLQDRAASRHHCIISVVPRGFRIRDLDSTNGTRLAGFRVEAAIIKSGTVLGVGRSKLRFEGLPDHVAEPVSERASFGDLLGESAAMRRIFSLLPRIAASGSNVVIEGETGTGKTLLASAIHDASPRAEAPFVVVDCAALTPTLVESQLFGHRRGAFTGAHEDRPGAFVAARGGTVFLDEVGELPLDIQPKLLRVLEERTVVPVGETRPTAIDVRVVAATNRDLREEVNRGRFRSDLFYRLHVVKLRIPPLRERPEDIPLLARHFFAEGAPAAGPREPPPELVEAFRHLRWSGNVRELRAAVERAIVLQDAPRVVAVPSPEGTEVVDLSVPFRRAKDQVVQRFEQAYLTALYEAEGGNISAAARTARVDRNHLRELLRRHGIVDAG